MLGFATIVSKWVTSQLVVCRKVDVTSRAVMETHDCHSPPWAISTYKARASRNSRTKSNEANPGSQSHARESADHTIENHAIRAGVRNPGKHTDAVGRKVCLRIIVPVRVQGKQPGEEVETYALLDNGSDVSLCDEKLTDQLGISGV